ncbi:MAG: amidohydrolase family protein [Steroidobacteraceae bacterium]
MKSPTNRGSPAKRLGLAERGLLKEGLKADLVVFDPDAVRDAATYEQPHQYAEGVLLVVINAAVVFEHARMTAARPGRVLYGPANERRTGL